MLRIPNQRWNNSLFLKFFKGNTISILHQFVSAKEDAFFDNQTFTTKYVNNDAYHLFTVFAQQKISKDFVVSISLKNIFNTNFTDIIGYNIAERNYTLGVEWNF